MKIKAYIYLPDSDIAFEGLHNEPKLYTKIIKELYAIKYKLKKLDYELYYDSNNISSFLEVANGFIPPTYLTGIGRQLQTIITSNSKNINTPHLRNIYSVYANWSSDLNLTFSPFVISESAECKLSETDNDKTICLCLGDSLNTLKDDLHVIRDNPHDNVPPIVIPIAVAKNDVGFIRWVTTLSSNVFILKNNSDFEPLDKFWHKERIYREKTTGYHWYFDFFHRENKIHYEVFDAGGDHLGEADKDGKMVSETKDNNKSISIFI